MAVVARGRYYANVMVDLETLGLRAGATILSIGAVGFDVTGLAPSRFHVIVSRADSERLGFVEDVGTIAWWNRQSIEARVTLDQADEGGLLVPDALARFTTFLRDVGGEDDRGRLNARIWGCGADFDNVLLAAAYDRAGLTCPWPFWNNCCFRTLKGLNLAPAPVRQGTYHHALDDAVYQAQWAVACLRRLEPGVGDDHA